MSKQNKLLLIIFTALLFVIVGEFIYYYSFQKSSPGSTKNPNTNTVPTKNPLLPPSENTIISGTFDINKLNLLLLNKDISTSVLTNEYVGKIVAVHSTPGIIPRPKISYDLALEIQAETVTKPFWAYYLAKDISVMKVVSVVSSIEKPMQFSELKTGDNITIKEIYDIKKNLTTEIKIIKK